MTTLRACSSTRGTTHGKSHASRPSHAGQAASTSADRHAEVQRLRVAHDLRVALERGHVDLTPAGLDSRPLDAESHPVEAESGHELEHLLVVAPQARGGARSAWRPRAIVGE